MRRRLRSPSRWAWLSYGVARGGQADASSPFQMATGIAAHDTKSLETKWP